MVLHQPDDSTVVTRTIHIAARPETVFAFFIDPLKMRQWKGINAILDPHPEGQFQVALNEQDTIRGEYVEVVQHRRDLPTRKDGTTICHVWPSPQEAAILALIPGRSGTNTPVFEQH